MEAAPKEAPRVPSPPARSRPRPSPTASRWGCAPTCATGAWSPSTGRPPSASCASRASTGSWRRRARSRRRRARPPRHRRPVRRRRGAGHLPRHRHRRERGQGHPGRRRPGHPRGRRGSDAADRPPHRRRPGIRAGRIGVNRGHVFSGAVGMRFRSTFTVMGDTVNLAARLMAAAPRGRDLRHAAGRRAVTHHVRDHRAAAVPGEGQGRARCQALAIGAETGTRTADGW